MVLWRTDVFKWHCCSGSDGLLKLWTVKSNECVKTFDEHSDKVWALAVSKDEQKIFSGAGDSRIILWRVSVTVQLQYDIICPLCQ